MKHKANNRKLSEQRNFCSFLNIVQASQPANNVTFPPRCLRCNVEFDHGLFVKWSPDSKAFVVQKAVQNCTEVYRMAKKTDGSMGDFSVAVTFPKSHDTDVIGLGIAASGRFIATCSDKTDLIVWSLKGDILAKLDTCHNLTYCCKVKYCTVFYSTLFFSTILLDYFTILNYLT